MIIRFIVGAALALTVFSGFAQSREMSLHAFIQKLQQLGHTIIYSDAVVQTNLLIQTDRVDIENLEKALDFVGLKLQQHGSAWVISPGTGPVVSVEPQPVEIADNSILETVIVTGTRHSFPGGDRTASLRSLSSQEMLLVPSMASDAMRIALRLPGMSSVGVSAKPRIRGGLQDELLVIQDGVELLEPFHLADFHSAYSTIDHSSIESMEIYTGGFPSRYGNRMSGVMDLSNNWEVGDYNADIGISTFAEFINVRGNFGEDYPTDWSLSLRQGDLSDLTKYIQTRSGKPEYHDIAGRVNIELSDTMNLTMGVVQAKDDIVFEDEEERASSQIDTGYVWAGFDWQLSENLRSRMTISWLEFEREKLLASFEVDAEDEDKGGELNHRQKIQRLALRNDLSAIYRDQFFEFGWQAEYNEGEYRHVSTIDRGELAEIIGTEGEVERDINVNPQGWSGGAYVQAELQVTDRFMIQPSLRWDYQDYYFDNHSEYQLSPRLGLSYEFHEDILLRLSLGRFHQPESIQELQVLDGVTEFFPPQHSDQLVAGIEWSSGKAQFTGEIYHKRYGEQKGRFENMFNPFVLLPEMEPDRVGLRPRRAVAEGLDLDFKYAFLPDLNGNLRYSYMDANDRIEGEWIPRRWSQEHTVNAGLVWQKDSYSISLAATWHSGWRSSKLPDFVPEDTVIPLQNALNNVELDPYFSLDLSARKHWEIGRMRVEIYADIANITDHKNRAGIDYDVEEVDGGYALIPDHENLLRRVPSIGVTLSF